MSGVLRRMASTFHAVSRGSKYSMDYRLFFANADGLPISPWHDIPLYADKSAGVFNMICEIPRWTNAKMEIATKDKLNPIKQDVKKGKPRFVHNVFPHKGYIWNYGALPQTWEDPSHVTPGTGAKGDNDPIDVCEIGSRVAKPGDILKVKVLGVIALVDEGETDWKIIVIDVNDPLAPKLNDVSDVDSHMPGFLNATRDWFRLYKIPAGKPENAFGFDGQYKNKAEATKIIEETHEFWKKLMDTDQTGGLDIHSTTLNNSKKISKSDAESVIAQSAEPAQPHSIDQEVDAWHYVNGQNLKSGL